MRRVRARPGVVKRAPSIFDVVKERKMSSGRNLYGRNAYCRKSTRVIYLNGIPRMRLECTIVGLPIYKRRLEVTGLIAETSIGNFVIVQYGYSIGSYSSANPN